MGKRKRNQTDVYFPGSPEKKVREDQRANIRHVEISRSTRGGGAYKALAFGRKSSVLASEANKSTTLVDSTCDCNNQSGQPDTEQPPLFTVADDESLGLIDVDGDDVQDTFGGSKPYTNTSKASTSRTRVSNIKCSFMS
jgi:hypothetical protein